jgi:hypothetical protein
MTRYEKLKWMCIEEMAQWLAELIELPRLEAREWLQSKGEHGTKYNDILFSVKSAAEALKDLGGCWFCTDNGIDELDCRYGNDLPCTDGIEEWLESEEDE